MAMSDAEFDAFVASSCEALERKQATLQSEYSLGEYAAWSYNGETGVLGFTDSARAKRVTANVVQVGSYSTESNTWRWAWANSSIPVERRDEAGALRGLYERTGFDVFRNEACEADEQMAWEMTAMAVEHLDAIGCYRGPAKQLWVFFAIVGIQAA